MGQIKLWGQGKLKDAELELWDKEKLDFMLDACSMTSWICMVLKLGYPNIPIDSYHHSNAIPYCNWMQTAYGHTSRWILVLEKSSAGIWHAHVLIASIQRTDNCVRSAKNAAKHIAETCTYKCEPEILKANACKSGRAMCCYMMKNPHSVVTTRNDDASMMFNIYNYGLHSSYKQKATQRQELREKRQELQQTLPENSNPETGNELTTWCLTHMMTANKPLTMEDLCRIDPTNTKRFLHRPNLQKVITQCALFFSATTTSWSPRHLVPQKTICTLSNRPIHNYLLFQGINTDEFDKDMYKWIWMKDGKKNTMVLQGPSNSGKSAFFKHFISSHGTRVGYICNGSFPWQGLTGGCMLGVWEEPLLSSAEAEKGKQILGGERTSVAVKFSPPQTVDRVPILVTTNHDLWRYCTQEEETLSNRCFIYYCPNKIALNSDGTTSSKRSPNTRCYCGCSSGSRNSPSSSNIRSTECSSPDNTSNSGRSSFTTCSNSSCRVHNSISSGYGNASPDRQVGWSHYRITGGSITRTEIGCTDSSRHYSSCSTSTDHNYGSCNTDRSSNSDYRIYCGHNTELTVSDSSSGGCLEFNIGEYGALQRVGGRILGRRGSHGDAGSNRGGTDQDEETSILVDDCFFGYTGNSPVSSDSAVGGEVDTTNLAIPTETDWQAYCQYLLNQYGSVQDI